MTYRQDFTLPAELMQQVQEQGLEILPELIRIVTPLCGLLGHPPGNSQVFGVKRIERYLGILPVFIT